MAYHMRAQSKDITSHHAQHATPLPTYYSQQLPRWTSKSAFEDQKAFDEQHVFADQKAFQEQKAFNEKTVPLAPCYPLYPAPMPRFDEMPLPPRPKRRQLPKKAILIPWILAAVFFLTTLWFTSIALGVRLFIALQPVQEIHVVIKGDVLHDAATASAAATTTFTPIVTLSASATTTTAMISAPTESEVAVAPTATAEQLAPTPDAGPLDTARGESATSFLARAVDTRPTGFMTLARSM